MALEIFFFMRSKRLGDTVSVNNCLGAYAQAGMLVPAAPRPRPMGLLPTRSGGDDSIDVLVPCKSSFWDVARFTTAPNSITLKLS